jgi:hypothetical protein
MLLTRIIGVVVFAAIVLVVASALRRRPPVGFVVDVAFSPNSCGDGNNVVATVMGNQQARLNSTAPFKISDARWTIRNRLSTRAEKLLYVRAVPDVTFGEFVEFLDAVSPEVEVLSFITPEVERRVQESWCLSPSKRTVQRLWGVPRIPTAPLPPALR